MAQNFERMNIPTLVDDNRKDIDSNSQAIETNSENIESIQPIVRFDVSLLVGNDITLSDLNNAPYILINFEYGGDTTTLTIIDNSQTQRFMLSNGTFVALVYEAFVNTLFFSNASTVVGGEIIEIIRPMQVTT